MFEINMYAQIPLAVIILLNNPVYIQLLCTLFMSFQNKDSGLSRGFGFAVFRSREGLNTALAQSSHYLEGNKVGASSLTWRIH